MEPVWTRVRDYLLSHGPSSARDVYRSLGVSQSAFSLAVAKMRAEIVVIGARRSARYALARGIPEVGTEIPIYLVSESGVPELIARLLPIQPSGYFVDSVSPAVRSARYPDLPFWLNDVRPSGFLGRLVPRRHPELHFPSDVSLWSSNHVLRYATTLGRDLIGNLVLGDRALEAALQHSAPMVKEGDREEAYRKLARETLEFGAAGSSAAGEQPKFLAIKQESRTPVLVKFSPLGRDAINIRRRDLLICENHALEVIRSHGHDAASSEVLVGDDQTFLELARFDRTATGGRRGLMMLQTLSEQFTGEIVGWREQCRALEAQRIVSPEVSREILWRYYFGVCIANSDMHGGNLSFYAQGERILGIAPVYDMLPMAYAPRQEQIVSVRPQPPTLFPQEKSVWISAVAAAQDFWSRVQQEKRIEAEMRSAAQEWAAMLRDTAQRADG